MFVPFDLVLHHFFLGWISLGVLEMIFSFFPLLSNLVESWSIVNDWLDKSLDVCLELVEHDDSQH